MADGAAFATLVPGHIAAVVRTAAALVGKADAEDAAQEAIMRAWQAWPSLQDVDALRPWLLRITVNICLQWRRGRFGKRVELTQPLPEESADWLATLAADPGTSDYTGALDLRAALNQLGYDMRVVVVLRYYASMDASEVGEVLGIPAATVRTRLRRALMILRESLSGTRETAKSGQQERILHG